MFRNPQLSPSVKSGNVGQLPRLGDVLYGPVMHGNSPAQTLRTCSNITKVRRPNLGMKI